MKNGEICRSNAVQFAETGLLVSRKAANEGIEVGDHGLVLLNDLDAVSSDSIVAACSIYIPYWRRPGKLFAVPPCAGWRVTSR